MKYLIMMAAVSTAVLPDLASAQSGSNQPRLGPGAYLRQIERDYADRAVRERAQYNSPERRARADRLAAMANDGHCREAVATARREQDPDMADALVEACNAAVRDAPATAQAQRECPRERC